MTGNTELAAVRETIRCEEVVELRAGAGTKVGFAAWEGANGERGGVTVFSKEWRERIIPAC